MQGEILMQNRTVRLSSPQCLCVCVSACECARGLRSQTSLINSLPILLINGFMSRSVKSFEEMEVLVLLLPLTRWHFSRLKLTEGEQPKEDEKLNQTLLEVNEVGSVFSSSYFLDSSCISDTWHDIQMTEDFLPAKKIPERNLAEVLELMRKEPLLCCYLWDLFYELL